jgi:hypothetical protein
VQTSFDPGRQGFRFRNRFAGSHVLAELTRQGRLEQIVGLHIPEPFREVLGLVGESAEFWDGFGLCGGMSWAALDDYLADRDSDPLAAQPEPGSELFGRLVRRQADSFRGRQLIGTLIDWIKLPDSNPWWGFWMDSIGRRVVRDQWPKLKATLDGGRPEVLCLIRSRRPDHLSDNHQVVAIGYVETGGRVSVTLYDPNHPGQTPTIDFFTGSWLNRIEATQSTGEPVVGFFVWPHETRTA